jgi:sigma-B regulation protein RsbU (phosphoserine phosphatase)
LFVSLFYLRYDPRSRCLRYANAGHHPPLLARAGALACEPLDADGLILGVKKDVAFEEKALALAPGDRLLLYTDGVVEARDGAGEFFGMQRLAGLFAACPALPPREAVASILAELNGFAAGSACEDDVTLVAARLV